ncbi:MAG: cell wall hydrolase [Clostridiales bacterium]|nr:cell wall hydrolase [Clostridiales bacterium]
MNRKIIATMMSGIMLVFTLAFMVRADETEPGSGAETGETTQAMLFSRPIEVSPTPTPEPEAGTREYYVMQWNNCHSNYERYNMSAKAKAKIVGLSDADFDFFARVVQAEGDINGNDLTDKVLVACVIWNRLYCKKYPSTIPRVLRQRGQFEVVENGSARKRRTKDSEWAVMVAYMLVRRNDISPHLMAFNCINYNKGYAPYFYDGGNYFSCGQCTCSRCSGIEPGFSVSGYPRWTTHFYRPEYSEAPSEPSIEDIIANMEVRAYMTPIDPDETVETTPAPAEPEYDYNDLKIQ